MSVRTYLVGPVGLLAANHAVGPLGAYREPGHRALTMELLEDRRLLTVWTVTNNSGNLNTAGSLPWDVANAVGGDTIQFAPALDGQTITVQGGSLGSNATGSKPLTIVGPVASQLTIKGGTTGGCVLQLWINTVPLVVSGLTIAGFSSQDDVDVCSGCSLTITGFALSGGTGDGICSARPQWRSPVAQ